MARPAAPLPIRNTAATTPRGPRTGQGEERTAAHASVSCLRERTRTLVSSDEEEGRRRRRLSRSTMRLRGLIAAAAFACLLGAPSGARGRRARSRDRRAPGRPALKGLYFGKIDGLAGPMTAKGLRSFQRLTGLPVTGELGPRTRAELGALGRPLVADRVLVQGSYGWDVWRSVPARASRPSPAPRRRRSLRRFDEGGPHSLPALARTRRGRGRRPATRSAFGRGTPHTRRARPTSSPAVARISCVRATR